MRFLHLSLETGLLSWPDPFEMTSLVSAKRAYSAKWIGGRSPSPQGSVPKRRTQRSSDRGSFLLIYAVPFILMTLIFNFYIDIIW